MLLFQNTTVSRSYFCHSNLAQLDAMLTPTRPMGPCRCLSMVISALPDSCSIVHVKG